VELIAERGVHGFSLAEASRRLGVTAAAPYRHFADRDELLAAVATRAAERMGAAVAEALATAESPEQKVAATAAAYVRFAAEQRPLFETLFGAGLDKKRYPELEAAAHDAERTLDDVVRELAPDDEQAAQLMLALVTATHGVAVLLLDGFFGGPPDDPAVLAGALGHAVSLTRAVLAGRAAL
jgi:AcrR family transcriptional regulator